MKRKKLILMMALAVVVTSAGCGKTTEAKSVEVSAEADLKDEIQEEESIPEENEEAIEEDVEKEDDSETGDIETLGEIEVDEGLFNVTITLPADFVGVETQEELDEAYKDTDIKSATLNEDKSATLVMSKKQHKAILEATRESINSSLAEMIGSEDFPNITDIKANENFTEFEITTKSEELDFGETFSTYSFMLYGGMYAIFEGTEVDNISVKFLNADSGEIIEEFNSKDLEQ